MAEDWAATVVGVELFEELVGFVGGPPSCRGHSKVPLNSREVVRSESTGLTLQFEAPLGDQGESQGGWLTHGPRSEVTL